MNKFLIIFVLLLTSCATQMTMTGKQYPPVNTTDVKILFKEKPKCKYEELGFISTPLSWDQNSAVNKAREKAAQVGADYIMIETVHMNAYNDASVSAVAYKCASVNRDKVDLKAKG